VPPCFKIKPGGAMKQRIKRKKKIQHSQEFWDKHLENWHKSGLTQVDYCRIHGIRPKAFSHRKVLKFGADDISEPLEALKPKEPTSKELNLVALPIQLPEHSLSDFANNTGINISLGNKASINFSTNFDRQCLAEILRILSEL
jgi:hypothetical protein